VADVVVVSRLTQLHLNRDDVISALDDEINLPFSAPRPEVTHMRLGGLRVDPDTERHQ
jgi:hypothetical protein